jgi:hypothetical protein
MGIFFRTIAACVAADAIDRAARRPTRYWYPNQPGLPPSGTHIPYLKLPPPARRDQQTTARRAADWDLGHPERPR